MKNLFTLVLALSLFNCKQEAQKEVVKDTTYKAKELDITTSVYPDDITQVFNAHGGLDTWNSFKGLAFTMKKPTGDEVTITNLKNRKSYIETANFKIGYNGTDVWLDETDGFKYEGNPQFYYNLMFYFYAMPFILADDGITYETTEPLAFEGKDYPGIKISYNAGVGESPDDEYILYYDAETHKMVWLAYTVTYFTKEKSKDWHFIRYTDWQMVDDLALPKILTWFNSEGFKIAEKRNDLEFTSIKLSKTAPENSFFEKPKSN
tara:strand:+ start:190 stop:978 length:789 start_codon:yes stop_codon:yes gene_type:complete